MNKLILEILPDIQDTAKKISRNTDQQNDLTQFIVLECYKYEDIVKRLYQEKRLKTWLYTATRREYLKMRKGEPTNALKDIPDETYVDLLEEFKPYLTQADKAWIRVYIECGGKFAEIQRVKKIHQETASERIKYLIEKCKKLKSIL